MSLINNAEELRTSWEDKRVNFWVANDGVGDMTNIFREHAVTNKIMPYEEFKEKINYYLKQVVKGQKEAFIKEVYN